MEPSSSSEAGSGEKLLLATSRPKKRAGRRIFKETRHPVFRGIRKRNKNKWVCELREPNTKTRIWLGTYPTPEMAARAHDVAALVFRGKSACLNFADSAWRLPVPASKDAVDIRRAAAEAAEAFRPDDHTKRKSVVVKANNNSDGEVCSSSSTSDEKNIVGDDEKVDYDHDHDQFLDEEAMFDMPTLLVSMAEGLLLSPPRNNWDFDDHADCDIDVSNLWSYSI